MIYTNPRAQRSPYPAALQRILSIERARDCRRWLSGWSMLNPGPTPLRQLPGLARHLCVGQVHIKDESVRSPLRSFKALGAPVALLRGPMVLAAGGQDSDLHAGPEAVA